MRSVSLLVRKIPAAALVEYFERRDIAISSKIKGGSEVGSLDAAHLNEALEQLEEDARASVLSDFDHIEQMSDELGDVAMLEMTGSRPVLEALPGPTARALWMLVNESAAFRRAEEIRFTDEHRRGRMWDGYVAGSELLVSSDKESLDLFKDAARKEFGSKNIHVDVFERAAKRSGGDRRLVQVTVLSEGPMSSEPAFVQGELAWRAMRPVYEAAIAYDPLDGTLEVVGRDKATREIYARLVAEQLLSTKFGGQRIALRRYHLDKLRNRQTFPTDAEDGIDEVKLVLLRLMPLGSPAERLVVECTRKSATSIWQLSEAQFGRSNPLRSGWTVTQARLSIRFRPPGGQGRGRVLPVNITMPHRCDLKERTDRERIIGAKYLERWGLLRST